MPEPHTPLTIRQDMRDPEYRALFDRLLTPVSDPCHHCGDPIPEGYRGYRRRYCSDACRMAAKRARDRAYYHEMRRYR